MENNCLTLTKINDVPVQVVVESGSELVPIKPLCELLGIAFEPQYKKLRADEILGSTITLGVTVGADSKDRLMVCLPLKYVFGWLFTINPANVLYFVISKINLYVCDVLHFLTGGNATSFTGGFFISIREKYYRRFRSCTPVQNYNGFAASHGEVQRERHGRIFCAYNKCTSKMKKTKKRKILRLFRASLPVRKSPFRQIVSCDSVCSIIYPVNFWEGLNYGK